MSLNIQAKLPERSIVDPILSAERSVLTSRNAEIPSQINGDYSYSTNSRIEFDINSPSEFIDFANSYLRFDVKSTGLDLEGADCSAKYLPEGGVHSFFREVRLETQSGVLIDRIQRYNKFYSMMSGIFHSKDYVDSHLQSSGDSIDYDEKSVGLSNYKSASGSAFAYDATGGASEQLVTGTASMFICEVDVGDIVAFIDDDGASYTGEVSAITSATTMNVLGLGTADFTANKMYIVKKDGGYSPARKRIPNTSNAQVTCKLMLPFFQLQNWYPLFLVRSGLRLIIELERPELVLVAPKNTIATGYSGASYILSKMNFVAPFILPNDVLREAYLQMFKQSGISFSMLGYEHRLNNISSGNTGVQNLRLNVNARSVRHLLSFCQNIRAETVTQGAVNSGKSTYTCDGMSQRIKAGVSEWQVEIGSHRFPQSSPLTISPDNSELLTELEKTMKIYDVEVGHRWQPHEFVDVAVPYKEFEQGTSGGEAQATKVIFTADFSRDASPWSGMDATLHSINVQPNISTNYQLSDFDGSNPTNSELYWHSFIGHDKIVTLSEAGGLTVLT